MGNTEGTSTKIYMADFAYNPCYCFELATKSLFKCFGFDSLTKASVNQKGQTLNDPPSLTEQEMKASEDLSGKSTNSSLTLTSSPVRPPIDPGDGGQTN
ncbi:unnamed protein product [Ilex paraguariensis]|uniref:Uncharacterized protein n=1 Tax=Ilex paraguariensis TaxID=185542 RepID=A0ABC8RT52_9AQUA